MLAGLVDKVYSIELVLIGQVGGRTASSNRLQDIETKQGDGYLGWKDAALHSM